MVLLFSVQSYLFAFAFSLCTLYFCCVHVYSAHMYDIRFHMYMYKLYERNEKHKW